MARESVDSFSPVDDDPPLRWQRRIGLVAHTGLSTGRRAAFYAAITWLPIAAWAALTGHLWSPTDNEPLLKHAGVTVRCLVAIPLFILAEAAVHATFTAIVAALDAGGMFPPDQRSAFTKVIAGMRRLRNATLPWIAILAVIAAWTLASHPDAHVDSLAWAANADGSVGFGGLWFAYVVRPVFLALLAGWLWRLLLVAVLLWSLGRLKLELVPTHPDHLGGLGVATRIPAAFALVTFGLSAVVAAHFSHEMLYHGATLSSIKIPLIGFVVIWSILLLLPLLTLAPMLMKTKREAVTHYSRLVAEHGRAVKQRWIDGAPARDCPILDAPEIGALADANAIFDAVTAMKPVPINKGTLLAIAIPLAIPLLVLAALQIPPMDMLSKLAKALL